MIAFEYAHPSTLDDAVSLLSDEWGETEVLAGGTDLVTSLKQDITQPLAHPGHASQGHGGYSSLRNRS